MEKIINKKKWSKTKSFRVGMSIGAIAIMVAWIVWLVCDTIFLKTGIYWYEGVMYANNPTLFKTAKVISIVLLSLGLIYLCAEIMYIVYRSFAWKTDKHKVIYESVVHGLISLLMLIFIALASYRLFNNKWIAEEKLVGSESLIIVNIDLYYTIFATEVSIVALSAAFSLVTLFQAKKPFKFHNLYFDFSLMVVILAVMSIPIFAVAVYLICVHPNFDPYPADFWLHISGQALYSVFGIIKLSMVIFLTAKMILLIRITNGALKRTKRSITIAAILAVANLIIYVIDRSFAYTIVEIYNNENWMPQIIMISISFGFGIVAGWNSTYRYIELYAKPARQLDKEPLILN